MDDNAKTCQECGTEFSKRPSHSRSKWERAKFCSTRCAGLARRGKRIPHLDAFRGQPAWNKGMVGYMAGEANGRWKGDDVGYGGIHSWMARNHPKIGICSHCSEQKPTFWANISGEYRRDRADWIELCNPCHQRYDNQAWRDRVRCNSCGSHDINFPSGSRRTGKP